MDDRVTTNSDHIDIDSTMKNKELIKKYIRKLSKEQMIDLFMKQLKEPDKLKVPLSIFNKELSSLEVIVKYLKEELGYSNKKTALLLSRSPQNIWITYRNTKRKHPEKLFIRKSEHDIPLSIFEDKQLSILESIVMHLKQSYSDKEITNIVKRDKKTVATVYHRARKKLNK